MNTVNEVVVNDAIAKAKEITPDTQFSLLDLISEQTWDALGAENRKVVGKEVSKRLQRLYLAKRLGDTKGKPSAINLYQREKDLPTDTEIAENLLYIASKFPKGVEFSVASLLDNHVWNQLEPSRRINIGKLFSTYLKENNVAVRIDDTVGKPARVNLYSRI